MVVTDKILAIPRIVGSSSSSQLLLELIHWQNQPKAILLGERDAILGIASLVGRELGFGLVPVLQTPLDRLETGMAVAIGSGGKLRISMPV